MWTAEELGIIGGNHYIKSHKSEEKNLQFVLESDGGTFKPLGFEVTGTEEVVCILERIMKLVCKRKLNKNASKDNCLIFICSTFLIFFYFLFLGCSLSWEILSFVVPATALISLLG